jgi:hypothetical protein
MERPGLQTGRSDAKGKFHAHIATRLTDSHLPLPDHRRGGVWWISFARAAGGVVASGARIVAARIDQP